jgi:hypothetical protein
VPVEAMGHMPLIAANDCERQRSIHLRSLFYFTPAKGAEAAQRVGYLLRIY